MIRPACTALMLLILSAGASLAAAAPPEDVTQAKITFDGKVRTYLIETPQGSGPKPTIIMLHGRGSTAAAVAKATGLAPLGTQQDFVAVFPNALAHEWNHFPPDPVPDTDAKRYTGVGGPPDDVGFLKALLADLVQRGVTDPKHVYLAGFSNGGFMATRLACEDADAFAAIALISSSMSNLAAANCHPSQPLPILIEKGTADTHVPYAGGQTLDHTFTGLSADQLTDFFTKLDGCSQPADASQIPGPKKKTIDVSTWSKCTSGPVVLYKVNGGIHTVYKVPDPAETLWDFFKDHSR